MTKETAKPNAELAFERKDIVSVVTSRIDDLVGDGKLHLPEHYSAENALMAAWLKLQSTKDKSQRPALSVCTKDSVANACLDMIVQGLTPAKDQCYFVVYGDKLICLRSYFGDEALLQRIYPKARVYAEPVYKGDELEYEIVRGRKVITKHSQKLANVGDLGSIVAAYAIVELGEGHESHCEIMTLAQIEKAWGRGQNWPAQQGKQSAHRDHPEEFTKKTVIARACKRLINSSNDSYLVRAVKRQAHLIAETEMEERIKEEGNKDVIDLPPEEGEISDAQTIQPAERTEKVAKELADKPAEPTEESPTSPSARFLDLMLAHDLDAPKARKLVASMRKVKDVRNLGNVDYAAILGNTDNFLVRYHESYDPPAGSQAKLGGPGF